MNYSVMQLSFININKSCIISNVKVSTSIYIIFCICFFVVYLFPNFQTSSWKNCQLGDTVANYLLFELSIKIYGVRFQLYYQQYILLSMSPFNTVRMKMQTYRFSFSSDIKILISSSLFIAWGFNLTTFHGFTVYLTTMLFNGAILNKY